MKKKALVAGVLLSVFSMSVGVQAAMTIDGSVNPITITNKEIDGDRNLPTVKLEVTTSDINDIIINFQPTDGDSTLIYGVENGLQCEKASLNRYYRVNGKLEFGDSYIVGYDASADRASIYNNGWVEFNDKVSIVANEHKAIYVASDARTRFNQAVDILVNNYADGALVNDGRLDFGRPSQISNIGGYAVVNSGTFILNSDNVDSNSKDGNTILLGDVKHIAGNNVYTRLNIRGAGSYFQGNIYGSDDNFHLYLGKGGSWILDNPQTEVVTGLHLDGGKVYLYGTNTTQYNTLKLNNFSTNGDFSSYNGGFYLHTNLGAGVGDKLEFAGTTPDFKSIPLYVEDFSTNTIYETDGKSLTLVIAPSDTNMDFSPSFSARYSPTDYYLYIPSITTDINGNKKEWHFNGWQMATGPVDPDPIKPPDFPNWPGDAPDDPPHKTVNDETKQTKDEYYINHVELDNTFKRINDIRTDPSEVGVWLRGENGKMKIRSYGYKYNLMSGGYDWKYESDAAKMFLGFGISYAKNTCDTGIIGDTKSMGYNLYGSWLGRENNDYVDVIVKYGTLDKKYAGLDDNNVFVTGDYDKKLFSVAAKYGRRITRDDGWYYEPSVGLTWGRIGSADFTDSQGIKIHADSSTSKMATLGMQVGNNIQGTEFYGLFQVRHDFDGKMHVSVPGSDLPGSSVYDDMGGTWYKVGIGAARKINKNNSFYMDIEKDFGNKVKKPYAIGAGYRYTF